MSINYFEIYKFFLWKFYKNELLQGKKHASILLNKHFAHRNLQENYTKKKKRQKKIHLKNLNPSTWSGILLTVK